MPAISVIIPTYNGSRYIREAIDSVLVQTFRDFEIIVVDDGSIEPMRDVLELYINRRKIRYFHQENGGPAKARNMGIKAARGKWLAFLDSDDLWFPDKLKRQIEFLRSNQVCRVVHCNFEIIQNGNLIENELDRKGLVRDGWVFDSVMLLKHWVFMSCLLVESSVIEQVGLFNESLRTAEDTNLVLRIARQYPFSFLNRVLVRRRIHDGSVTASGDGNIGTFKNLEDIAYRYPELHPSRSRLMREAYAYRYRMLGCSCFRSGNYSSSRPFFRAYAANEPSGQYGFGLLVPYFCTGKSPEGDAQG